MQFLLKLQMFLFWKFLYNYNEYKDYFQKKALWLRFWEHFISLFSYYESNRYLSRHDDF